MYTVYFTTRPGIVQVNISVPMRIHFPKLFILQKQRQVISYLGQSFLCAFGTVGYLSANLQALHAPITREIRETTQH